MQHTVHNIILLTYRRNHIIFIIPWQKREIFQFPFFISLVIHLRVHHFYQMTHTPGDDIIFIFYISILSSGYTKHLCKISRNTRFLRNNQFLTQTCTVLMLFYACSRRVFTRSNGKPIFSAIISSDKRPSRFRAFSILFCSIPSTIPSFIPSSLPSCLLSAIKSLIA